MNTSAEEENGSGSEVPPSTDAALRRIPLLENRIDSRDLFVATREITILHGDEAYRLRLTAQNKLILTK